jgi:hypothetical protein
MRYERVKVKRDDYTTYNKAVLPWEIAILEYTFGEGSVERLNQFVDNATEYPDTKDEFHRLIGTYGSDPESGIPYVASVYGNASAGVNHLRRVMTEAFKASQKPLPKVTVAKLKKEFSADPLMS